MSPTDSEPHRRLKRAIAAARELGREYRRLRKDVAHAHRETQRIMQISFRYRDGPDCSQTAAEEYDYDYD